jgi:hypothetical protein
MDSSIGVKGPVIALPVNYWRAFNLNRGTRDAAMLDVEMLTAERRSGARHISDSTTLSCRKGASPAFEAPQVTPQLIFGATRAACNF